MTTRHEHRPTNSRKEGIGKGTMCEYRTQQLSFTKKEKGMEKKTRKQCNNIRHPANTAAHTVAFVWNRTESDCETIRKEENGL